MFLFKRGGNCGSETCNYDTSEDSLIFDKVRAERVQLSITAQAYGTTVESALRRRLHSNVIKLQDLDWQREEVIRDSKSLENELEQTERSIHDTIDRRKVVEGRLAGRSSRPLKEQTVDQVSYQLRAELGKLRKFTNDLRINRENIISLQNHLRNGLEHIECCAEDIMYVVRIDQDRLQARSVHENRTTDNSINTAPINPASYNSDRQTNFTLEAIKEESEYDL
ncbi:unnamed protein product, partial [Iphiclides podalirius]